MRVTLRATCPGIPMVDVRDVAKVHIAAAESSTARGRYVDMLLPMPATTRTGTHTAVCCQVLVRLWLHDVHGHGFASAVLVSPICGTVR